MLVLISWLRDVEMCGKECKLSNLEAVELMKYYTSDNVRSAVEFHLDTNSASDYQELTEHHRPSFKSSKTFPVFSDFYSYT